MKLIFPVLIYLVFCVIAILAPTSEGYDTILWRLFIGQVYAIPAFIIAFCSSLIISKKKANKKDKKK